MNRGSAVGPAGAATALLGALALGLGSSGWPAQGALADLVLVAAALLCAARGTGTAPLATAPVAIAAALLAASHLAAADAHSSWQNLGHWARLALAVGLGAALVSGTREARWLARAACASGAVLVAWAGWQAFVRYPALLERPELLPPGAIAQLEDGRANGPFLLPSHLAFLLAAAAVLAIGLGLSSLRAGRRREAVAATGAVAACLVGLAWTGSLSGALVLAAGLGALGLAGLRGRARAGLLVAGLVAAVTLVLAGISHRGDELRRENPALARVANWRTAGTLVRESPTLGVGGGAYAWESLRVRPAGANAARHAHQQGLEAAAEHGAWVVPLLGAFVAATARAAARASRPRRPGADVEEGGDGVEARLLAAAVGAAALAVLASGLLDFGWADPAWAILASILVGACWGLGGPGPVARRRAAALATGACAVVLLTASVPASLASGARERALEAAGNGEHARALALLERARTFVPRDADPWSLAAQAALAAEPGSLAAAERAEALARRGVELSRRRASLHAVHARTLAATGRPLQAWLAAARAASLAPTVPEHVELREALSPWEVR